MVAASNHIDLTTPRTIPHTENIFSFRTSKIEMKHSPKIKIVSRLPSTRTYKTCLYRTGKCSMPRHVKSNGSLHKMCTFHRSKANENQRRLDQKKKDAGFHRREKISPFKIKGVLQPKSTIVMNHDIQQHIDNHNETNYLPLEDIFPEIMIPFLMDSYIDIAEDSCIQDKSDFTIQL